MQPDTVRSFNDGLHGRINESACVQCDGNAVTDLEFVRIFWLFAGWHGKETVLLDGSASAKTGVKGSTFLALVGV